MVNSFAYLFLTKNVNFERIIHNNGKQVSMKKPFLPLDDFCCAYKTIDRSAGQEREGFPPLHIFQSPFNCGAAK
jgi:hypothetical protein